MTEPSKAGAELVEQVDRMRRKQRTEPEEAPSVLLGPDDYDPEAVRGEQGAVRWMRAIPSRFLAATLTDFEELPDLGQWSDRPAGRNLVLVGPVGTGKTHAAVAAVRGPADRGLEIVFLPVVELLDLLRPGGPDDALVSLSHADVLIIDDLGSERATDWTAERLYALVNRRWLEERPTVATSNLAPKELLKAVGDRVFSRLVGNDAVVLRLTGPDRRRQP